MDTISSSMKTETGELNECITGYAGCETWKSNRISTLRNHSVRWTSTFPVMTNRFGKTTGCHTTLAEIAFLDKTASGSKFNHNNFRYILFNLKVQQSPKSIIQHYCCAYLTHGEQKPLTKRSFLSKKWNFKATHTYTYEYIYVYIETREREREICHTYMCKEREKSTYIIHRSACVIFFTVFRDFCFFFGKIS